MDGQMNAVQMIHDLVRSGDISPNDGAALLDLRDELKRKAFWRGFRDGLSLGPLWRWIDRAILRRPPRPRYIQGSTHRLLCNEQLEMRDLRFLLRLAKK